MKADNVLSLTKSTLLLLFTVSIEEVDASIYERENHVSKEIE
jgi:hypothetical protein